MNSIGSTTNLRTDSARDTFVLAASIARWISASTAGFVAAPSRESPRSSPLFSSHVGSISGSRVMSAEMKGF